MSGGDNGGGGGGGGGRGGERRRGRGRRRRKGMRRWLEGAGYCTENGSGGVARVSSGAGLREQARRLTDATATVK